MPNMTVQYSGPNPALWTLTKELRRDYGDPARTYEFVTGYKSPSNVSSHNADSRGVAHGVDIFVGPGNLTEAQGIHIAEQLRVEGTRGTIPGHPDRLAYIIHRRRIAGDHTNWAWVAYTGPDPHTDHIHVSAVFDYYWGDPIPGNPADYNSTAPWNLGRTITRPQSGNITPIKQEFTVSQAEEILREIRIVKEQTGLIRRNGGVYTLRQEVADSKTNTIEIKATLAAMSALIAQLATSNGTPIDYTKIEATVKDSVKDALANGVDLDATVNIKK